VNPGKPRQTNCLGCGARSFVIGLLALLAFALWPNAASAAAPVAMDESVQIANPTMVPLEATTTGMTEMTFAIASNPTRGSLGQISSPTCQPTGTGSTGCKATVIYTPNQCTNGPDSFTYTAKDTATMVTSSPATVTLSPGPTASSSPPSPTLPQAGAATAGAVFTGVVRNALPGATVDFGDNTGAQPLVVDSSGNAPLFHAYAAEGSYVLTATNYGSCGMTATASERIDVLLPDALGLAVASVPPGGVARITVPGPASLTATLTVSPTDPAPGAGIVGATYPATSPLFGLAGPAGEVLAAYDIRSISVSTNDSAVVTFTYPDGGVPTAASVRFFDRSTNTFVPFRASTLLHESLVIDVPHHRITLVIDRTSFPTITGLNGTRFAVVGRPPAISGLAVTPRCVARAAIRSLRLRLTLSQRATLQIHVHRRAGVRAPPRCGGHDARATPAGHRVLRLRGHLRPGVYRLSVLAHNVHGRSRVASASFVVATS
jgi:Bacterial Ig domain